MAKDTVIFYQEQVDICRRHLSAEQFGRLMYALFEVDNGEDPDVDDDIIMAFEFMSLQKRLDKEKYEAKCKRNRENGKKGGRPKADSVKTEKSERLFEKANGFFENPNDNDNDNEKDKDNDNDAGFSGQNPVSSADSVFSLFGEHENVELTQDERQALKDKFERSGALIDEVSEWIRNAKNPVPNHYGFCLRWARNADWPKRRQIEPPEPIVVKDPLDEEEQERMVAQMRARVNGMFSGN